MVVPPNKKKTRIGKKKVNKKKTIVKKKVIPPPQPVVKKGFFTRLKENVYKHRYKIAAGVGTALVAGAGTGLYLQNKKQKELLAEQSKEISKLKQIPLPSTLNINSLKKYFDDSHNLLNQLNQEKEALFVRYTSEVSKFTDKLDQLNNLEGRLKTANEEEKMQINKKIEGLRAELNGIRDRNSKLEEQLNAKVKEYGILQVNYAKEIERAQVIIQQKNLSDDEKEKQLQSLNEELSRLKYDIESERKIKEEREKQMRKAEARYKISIGLLRYAKNAQIKLLKGQLSDLLKKYNESEVALSSAISKLASMSNEVQLKNSELDKLNNKLRGLSQRANVSEDEVNNLKQNILNLEQQLNDKSSEFLAKQEEINQLQKSIAGQAIEKIIAEYEQKYNDYLAKNEQLKNQQSNDDLKMQNIRNQIEQNNIAADALRVELERLKEVQLKIQADNEKLKKLKEQQVLQNVINIINKRKEQKKIFAKNLAQGLRLRVHQIELEKEKQRQEQEARAAEIERLRLEKEAEEKRKHEEQMRKLQSMIKELKSLNQKPQYLVDILDKINDSENPYNYINTYSIYQNLSVYNDQLYTERVSLNNLYNTIKGYININVRNMQIDADKIDKGYLITQFNDSPEMKQINISIEPPFEDLKNNISNLINKFIKLKDSIYPVRIVINFGKQLPAKSPVTTAQIPKDNYNYGLVQGDPKKIRNILYNQTNTITKYDIATKQDIVVNTIYLNETSNYKKGPPQQGTKIDKEIYGPFYTVTNTSDNTYNVDEDIYPIFNKNPNDKKLPHLIYSAYGFSGSGKSYTLIQTSNKNNVLTRVINAIKTNAPSNIKKNLQLRYSIYDYYGEHPDPSGCMVLPGDTTINGIYSGGQNTTKIDEIVCFISNQIIPLDNYSLIDIGIKQFERERQKNYAQNLLARTKYHIRYTPNNDQSSRSHLFVDIDILNGSEPIGRVSIIDMAGSEDVETIQQSYFISLPTVYNSDLFIETLPNISIGIQNVIKSLSSQSSKISSSSTIPDVDNIKSNFKFKLGPIEQVTKNGNFIIKKSWTDLMNNFIKLGINYPDMKDFIENYNFYNYYVHILPVFKKLKENINNITYLSATNNLKTIYLDNVVADPRTGIITSNYKWENYNSYIDLSELSTYFKNVGAGEMPKKYFDISSFIPKLPIQTNGTDAARNSRNENRKEYFKRFKEALKQKLDSLPDFINKNNNGLFGQLVNLNLNEMSEQQKRQLNSSTLDEKDLKSKLNKWNRRYLYNIHCSLRYQGNFIVNTLEQMVQYISCLQNNTILNNRFPGNILHTDIQIKGQTRSYLRNSQPKFILFTNIRLDFDVHGTSVASDKLTQNTNIRDAYIRSIDFANK